MKSWADHAFLQGYYEPPTAGCTARSRIEERVANSSVILHGDRLLQLEEGPLPFEMHPDSPESMEACNAYGKRNRVMSARPRVEPLSGERVVICYC